MNILGKESSAKSKAESGGKSAKPDSSKKDKHSRRRSSPAIKSLEDVRREKRERQQRERRERERRERLRRERERAIRVKVLERQRRERERERRRLQILREREESERQERLRLERERARQREMERERERERQERERMKIIQERQIREEREKLQRERERLERERLLRMERERLDRQRVEERRGVKRGADPYAREKSPARGPGFWPDSKRAAADRDVASREFFSGASHKDRSSRDLSDSRAPPGRERRGDVRAAHVDPRASHSSRDEARDEHRRAERATDGRSNRDRRGSWEHGTENGESQKGLSMLLQRAGVTGVLGSDAGARSGLSKPIPQSAGGSSSRERMGESWHDRSGGRAVMSSHSMATTGSSSSRVGRAMVSDAARGWPVEKEHDRGRERARSMATRELPRSAWGTSASASMMAQSVDRRTVIPPGRSSGIPPRMVSHHSGPGAMTVAVMDSRRAVAMSGRSDPFRGATMPSIPRSGTMRRY